MGRHLGTMPPAEVAFSITPDDDTDLSTVGVCLTASTAGTAAVHDMNGNSVTLYLAAGAVIPLRVRRVLSTGTTASGIVGLVAG